jgi:N-acetylmuramoyl-L-alanine amidase
MFTTPLMCLALAVYHEARGENLDGQLAVAEVVINRVQDNGFPNNVCAVVMQKNQFSFYWDGKSDKPRDKTAFATAVNIAQDALDGKVLGHGATFYHATYVRPYWADLFEPIGRVGKHIFYMELEEKTYAANVPLG